MEYSSVTGTVDNLTNLYFDNLNNSYSDGNYNTTKIYTATIQGDSFSFNQNNELGYYDSSLYHIYRKITYDSDDSLTFNVYFYPKYSSDSIKINILIVNSNSTIKKQFTTIIDKSSNKEKATFKASNKNADVEEYNQNTMKQTETDSDGNPLIYIYKDDISYGIITYKTEGEINYYGQKGGGSQTVVKKTVTGQNVFYSETDSYTETNINKYTTCQNLSIIFSFAIASYLYDNYLADPFSDLISDEQQLADYFEYACDSMYSS